MPALLPIRCRTELARQFHRTITNTINVLTEDRNTLTPLEPVMYVYTASAGQTEFTGADNYGKTLSYTIGRIEVFVNGVKANDNEYDSITGNSVVFLTGVAVGKIVTIVKMNVVSYPNPTDFYHIFLGKTTPWEDDTNPPTPEDTRAFDSETKRNILGVKRVQFNDTALLIPKNPWTTNTIYSSYSDKEVYATKKFYVTNTSNRIYKCIYSPGSPSTVEPSQISAGPLRLSDGYYWQLMYEIPAAERIKFMTADYVPVRFYSTSSSFDHNAVIDAINVTSGGTGYSSAPDVVILGDGVGAEATASLSGSTVSSVTITNAGSGYSFATIEFVNGGGSNAAAEAVLRSADLPITVNQDVASYAISAGSSINFIEVISGGTGYSAATTSITIEGDGVGAEATPIIDSSGKIVSVVVEPKGKGYTFANVIITGDGANASLRAVIEPQGGHGSDIPKELFATIVVIGVSIEDMLTDFFSANDFRQIGLIKNITNFTENEIFSASSGNACYVVEVPDLSKYSIDDVVSTDTDGEYIVANKTSANIYLIPVLDSITASSVLRNETTGIGSLSITTLTPPEISTKFGDIVYARNIKPIYRETAQTEQVKLYFSF